MSKAAFRDPSIGDLIDWQDHRRDAEPRGRSLDPRHNLLHVVKSAGHVAACLEHADHLEPFELEAKRLADLVIHVAWLGRAMGFNVSQLVSERMEGFEDGFWVMEDVP